MNFSRRQATVTALLAVLSGCDSGKQSGVAQPVHSPTQDGGNAAPAGGNGQQSLGASDQAGGGQTPDASKVIAPGSSLLDAYFDITATSLGIDMCKGNIQMKMSANFGKTDKDAQMFQIPQGSVDCGLFGKIDLSQMLGAYSQVQKVAKPVVADPDPNCPMIEIAQLGNGLYNPARPLLPSFIAGGKTQLASLNCTRQVTLTDSTANKTAQGTVQMHMLRWAESYKPPTMDRTFKNVFDVEIINTFDPNQIDLVPNMLFNRMEFRISLDPIAILYVKFEGKVSDMMAAKKDLGAGGGAAGGGAAGGGLGGLLSGGGGAGGGILGTLVGGITKLIDVDMEMNLTKQDGLDASAAATTSSGTNGDGEVIGGKPAASTNP